MIWAVIITAIITAQAVLEVALYDKLLQRTDERDDLQEEVNRLNAKIDDFREEDRERRERAAYDRGRYDGRQTDTLYRSIIKQYDAGERVTVMMNGAPNAKQNENRRSR